MTPPFTRESWAEIRLVVFDVDGTLYRQRPLQLRMATQMLLGAVAQRSLDAIRVIGVYRRIRERLADQETTDFDAKLIAETAEATGLAPAKIEVIVSQWMLQRPLPYLRSCMYANVDEVFRRLRGSGRSVAVLSDYPAVDKLAAMNLQADLVVAASDVGVMKPNPKGLETIMQMAGVTAAQTLFVGDRAERDGAAGQRAGVRTLIRSSKPLEGVQTFAGYDDPLFVLPA